MRATAALGLLSVFVFAFAQTSLAQTTPPKFENNYFVTGDYVVAGWANKQISNRPGYATGKIKFPDANSVPATGVPPGADVVAAFLYWATVESSLSGAPTGVNGIFRGYPITGTPLGNPNAPTSWSSGGCSGSSQGSKTMQVYRADVRPYLPVGLDGIVQPNTYGPDGIPNTADDTPYVVELKDSGSNGNTAPFTLGATLVIIYRVLSPDFPLNAIVLYDGAYAPANGSSTMTQPLQGFYQAAALPISKLTHIVGNGQANKLENVFLNSSVVPLLSLYPGLPPFPGFYNGSWDNPTWSFSGINNPVHANDASATTWVVPASNNSGCVSWGAIIFSTTVQDTDGDGLLDYWEQSPPNPVNPNSAGSSPGYVDVGSGAFVALPGANPAQRDIFVQLDYMCSNVNSDGTCNTTIGHSHYPPADTPTTPGPITMMSNAFALKGITLHPIQGNAIQELTCTDSTNKDLNGNLLPCPYPDQGGVVGWKGGFVFLKDEPLNINPATGNTYTEDECEQNQDPTTCVRRFQPGRKDSYHYTIFGHALGVANWNFTSGTLTSPVVASGNMFTFTTSTPHHLVVNANAGNGRVIISDAISNPNLNGVYLVQSPLTDTSFTIQVATAVTAPTQSTDPDLSVASGQAGTVSGFSDVGGADSVVTLGNWGPDGQTVPVQAGTFMHEFGHALALSHGGYSYPGAPSSYVPTVGANCKSNFQSVMNYLFQFDLLLNASGQLKLDYSGQNLTPLDEGSLPGGVTTTDGSALAYLNTKWYTPTQPGTATRAAQHCDGTPKSPTERMYRVEGTANPITPAQYWVNGDINFDGTINTILHGYDDWAHIDPRQIGATGSLSAGGGSKIGGGGGTKLGGGGGTKLGGGGGTKIGGGGGTKIGGGGVSNFETTRETANSVTRPPRSLTAIRTDTRTLHKIVLSWDPPTFGQVRYKVYRGANGASPTLLYEQPEDNTLTTYPRTYTDSAVSDCTTYTYVVSSVLVSLDPTLNGNESVPSNSQQYSVPCLPTGLTAANGVGSVTLNWTAASMASGAIGQYNIYRDAGIQPLSTVTVVDPSTTSYTYTDQSVVNNTTYTYYVTAASEVLNDQLVNGQQYCPAGQNCRESSAVSTTILVHWTVDSITTITSISPSPSTLGQPVTVSVTVSPAVGGGTPTRTVDVSDLLGGPIFCTITLLGGSGSCTGTPPILIGGLAAVGTRTISATYSGDLTFNGSSRSRNQQVIYNFNGFLTPLKLSSYSGSFNFGKTIPIKWQLKTYTGTYITMSNLNLTLVSLTAYFNGQPINGVCPVSPVSAKTLILFNSQQGAAGGSTFRYDTTNNQYIFNWDTSKANFGTGCYTLSLLLDDGSTPKTTSMLLK
jgi:hypothetical protein